MAPSHGLREDIDAIVRERPVRDGTVHGPATTVERLVSHGYTHAGKTLAANDRPGDAVAFHRPCKRLGVDKGDELRVASVDRESRTVNLEGADGRAVAWEPNRIAARAGGVEVYRRDEIELRAGDRIRWTRNDAGLGLVNSGTAEVAAVRDGRVSFRLEDGRALDLAPGDPQLRHLDRAWASTVGLLKKPAVCDSLSQYLVFGVGSEEPRPDGVVRLRFIGAAGAEGACAGAG